MTQTVVSPYILCLRGLAYLIPVPALTAPRPTPRNSDLFGPGRGLDIGIKNNNNDVGV